MSAAAIPNSLRPRTSNSDFLRQEILRVYEASPIGFRSRIPQKRVLDAIEAWVVREFKDPVGVDAEVKRLREALRASEVTRTNLALVIGERDRQILQLKEDPTFNPFREELEARERDLVELGRHQELLKFLKKSMPVFDSALEILRAMRNKVQSLE